MHNISESGVYYIANGVSDKPHSNGGMFVVAFYNGYAGGLYVAATAASVTAVYRVTVTPSGWTYVQLNV